jgi:pseudo-rSAM protein
MKKKWIYIEPFVFIWQDNTHYLFYNSLNGKKAFFQQNDTINPIVQSLSIEKNTYCIQLEEDIENKKDIVDFIRRLASNQLGNLVICSDNERPVNIPPKLNLEKSVDNPKYNNEYYDELILGNINELTIQVSGECNFNWNTCDEYHLQLIHCCKSGHFLTKSNLENLVMQIKHLNLQKVNITGGNILALWDFEFIVDIFSTANVLKIYNVHYKQINSGRIQFILDKDKTSLIRISVHCDDIDKTDLLKQIEIMGKYRSRILWSFVVSSEKELEFCYSVLDQCKSIKNEIKPFYNKDNEEFIKEFVFIDNEDIQNINPNKKQIFANQVLNRNYFGKITILANGKIFDNINFKVAGNIDDCLEDVIHKIITEGRSLRWIRSNDICDNCLYKLICPPPSNLELVMKSKVICQTPKSYKSA